jgi:hypothetical protein
VISQQLAQLVQLPMIGQPPGEVTQSVIVLVAALARAEQLRSGQGCYCPTAAYVFRSGSQTAVPALCCRLRGVSGASRSHQGRDPVSVPCASLHLASVIREDARDRGYRNDRMNQTTTSRRTRIVTPTLVSGEQIEIVEALQIGKVSAKRRGAIMAAVSIATAETVMVALERAPTTSFSRINGSSCSRICGAG